MARLTSRIDTSKPLYIYDATKSGITLNAGDGISVGTPSAERIHLSNASVYPVQYLDIGGSGVTAAPAPAVKRSIEVIVADLAEQLKVMTAQRDKLDADIQATLETLQSLHQRYGAALGDQPQPYGPKAFKGLAVLDAITKYFDLTKKIATVGEIAKGLLAGGFETKSADFTNTVYMTLRRANEDEDSPFVKFGKKWGLLKWADVPGKPQTPPPAKGSVVTRGKR